MDPASLAYDSLEPEGQACKARAGTNSRAFWFNSTPTETQELPANADSPQHQVLPALEAADEDSLFKFTEDQKGAPAADADIIRKAPEQAVHDRRDRAGTNPESEAAALQETGCDADIPQIEPEIARQEAQKAASPDADKENEDCATPKPGAPSTGKASTGKRTVDAGKSGYATSGLK